MKGIFVYRVARFKIKFPPDNSKNPMFIKMGTPSKLSYIVFHIMAKYLSTCKKNIHVVKVQEVIILQRRVE